MEICTVGGYEQVGKNMTALKIQDDVIIFDVGIYLPAVIEIQEQEKDIKLTEKELRKIGALPDDLVLDKIGWKDKVRAIIAGHAHLDHVGALPFLAHRYPNAEIIATPFTMNIIEHIAHDENILLKNPKKIIQEDSTYFIKGKSGNYKVEFIHSTHSTLQCVFVALHTPNGIFFYALDFKFDNYPVIGEPPKYKKLGEIGRKGVKALVIDSLYSGTHRKTPSERIARHLVEETMMSVRNTKGVIIVTTFSSHIARLKSIVDFGKQTNRKIFFIGRSLNKYVNASIKVGMCSFKKDVILLKFRNQINSFLSKVEKNRREYLIVCTGHQGETGAILDRISKDETPLKLREGDQVIFCSSIIPDPTNINAREKLDKRLRKKGVRIHTDVHVSGHGSREDMRDLIKILKPKHIIPAHGNLQQETPLIDLASEMGYKFGENAHLSANGKVLKL